MEVIRAVMDCCEHSLPRANSWVSPIESVGEVEDLAKLGCSGLSSSGSNI